MWFVSLSLFLMRVSHILSTPFPHSRDYTRHVLLQVHGTSMLCSKQKIPYTGNKREGIWNFSLIYVYCFPEYIFNLTQKFNKHLPFFSEIRTISFTCFTHLLQFTNTHRIHQIPGMSGLRGSPLELLRLILIFFFFCQSNEEVNVS